MSGLSKNCERCGDKFRTYAEGATYLRPLSTAVDQYGAHNAAFDGDHPAGYICPECAKQYDRFMDGKPTGEVE